MKSKTETVGNALEAECYSKASIAAFISLFPISITSLFRERETGIEPATSSLGIWASIESKDQSRVSASTISIKTAVIFTFRIRVQPNGLQLGCTVMMRTRLPSLVLWANECRFSHPIPCDPRRHRKRSGRYQC